MRILSFQRFRGVWECAARNRRRNNTRRGRRTGSRRKKGRRKDWKLTGSRLFPLFQMVHCRCSRSFILPTIPWIWMRSIHSLNGQNISSGEDSFGQAEIRGQSLSPSVHKWRERGDSVLNRRFQWCVFCWSFLFHDCLPRRGVPRMEDEEHCTQAVETTHWQI